MESNDTTTIPTKLLRDLYDLAVAREEQHELAEGLVTFWVHGHESYYSEDDLVRLYGDDHGQTSLEEMQELDKQYERLLVIIEKLTRRVFTDELLHLVRPKVVVPYPDATPTAG